MSKRKAQRRLSNFSLSPMESNAIKERFRQEALQAEKDRELRQIVFQAAQESIRRNLTASWEVFR